jgi:hypothetical protein
MNLLVFSGRFKTGTDRSFQAFRCIMAVVEVYVIRFMATHITFKSETGVENGKGFIFKRLLSAHSHAL